MVKKYWWDVLMIKTHFVFAVSFVAMLAVGSAWATDPADTSSTTDTVATEHTVYEKFKNAVQAQQMFINESEFAKAGFRGFMVNGVEFYLDANVPGTNTSGTNDNWAVIFPKKAVKFIYNFGFDSGSPFDTTKEGLQLPTNPLKSVQKYLSGNLVCSNRRLFAVNKTFGA